MRYRRRPRCRQRSLPGGGHRGWLPPCRARPRRSARARSDATSWRISSAYRKPHTCRQHHAALTGGVTDSEPARTTTRRIRIRRIRVAGLLVFIAAIAALSYQWPASSSSTAAPRDRPGPLGEIGSAGLGSLGEADGAVPDGTTVFDGEVPGVAKLDSDLLGALHRAAAGAGDGV